MAEIEELHARRHPLRRPHWLLLRWLGLRWQRRLGWLGVLLLSSIVPTGFARKFLPLYEKLFLHKHKKKP